MLFRFGTVPVPKEPFTYQSALSDGNIIAKPVYHSLQKFLVEYNIKHYFLSSLLILVRINIISSSSSFFNPLTAFCITPDEILTEQEIAIPYQDELFEKLNACSPKERKTALRLLEIYLKPLE